MKTLIKPNSVTTSALPARAAGFLAHEGSMSGAGPRMSRPQTHVEPAFGHNFGEVRIHSGLQIARATPASPGPAVNCDDPERQDYIREYFPLCDSYRQGAKDLGDVEDWPEFAPANPTMGDVSGSGVSDNQAPPPEPDDSWW